MKSILLIITTVVAGAITVPAQDLTALLQKGLAEEEINRDPTAAIEQYGILLEEFNKGRQLAATALFRIAECHSKLGDEKAAAEKLQQLVTLYPNQEKLVALARQNLAALGVAPALPIPGDLEIGEGERQALITCKSILRDRPDTIKNSSYISEAVKNNYLIVTRFLLKQGASPNAMYGSAKQRNTALLIELAVNNANLSIVKLLLSHGANVTPQSLEICIREGYSSIEPVLFEAINSKGEAFDYFPALGASIAEYDDDAFDRILTNGADPKTLDDDGLSLLHVTSALGREEVCEKLVKTHELPVNHCGKRGLSALHYAAQKRAPETVKTLLSLGADPKALAASHLGGHRRHAETQDFSVMMQLLETGYQKDHEAIVIIIDLLVAAGVDVNHQDSQGDTALHYAARSANTYTVTRTGSKPTSRTTSTYEETTAVVAALLKAGADKSIKNKKGRAPIDLADYKGFQKLLGTEK